VPNLPNLGATPFAASQGPQFSANATLLSQFFNFALEEALALAAEDLDIMTYDVFGLLTRAIADPGAFGFSNVTDACVAVPACLADSSGYLYWDDVHPTTVGHQLLAARFLAAVSVPEPGTVLLFGLGVLTLGVGSWRKRRGELELEIRNWRRDGRFLT
jgi:cholinesterase